MISKNWNGTKPWQNKGIDSIKYNFLNLPTKICFPNGDSIVYVYTVSGAKLRKTVYDNGTVQTTIDYVSGYQYKNGSLDFFAMEAGRVKKTSSGNLRYEYNLTDHLGNTRVSFADTPGNGTAVILQEDHYYAFGLRIEGLSSTTKDNKFTYNGKELEDDHGLNWYHYGARYYDPQLARWWSKDPVDELSSPYLYCANNPIIAVDPDGAYIVFVNGFHNGAEGGFSYWGYSFYQGIRDMFHNESGMAAFDGSLGGTFGLPGNLSIEARRNAGFEKGSAVAAGLINALQKDENGIIIESVKIVSHSMGTAYARGFTDALYKYADENDIQGLKIVEVDVAAYQGDKLPADPRVKTFQMGSPADGVAGNADIPGATRISGFPSEHSAGHSIGNYPIDPIVDSFQEFDDQNNGDQ